MMKNILHKLLLKLIYKSMPIQKNRIVFTSFNGHYSDSPKYISQKMHEMAPELEQVWLLKKQYMSSVPEYVNIVDSDDEWEKNKYCATAHVLIDNVYGTKGALLEKDGLSAIGFRILSFLNHKRGQMLFTTWHGTPLKRMGRDLSNAHIKDFSCPDTTMLLGNRYTLDIMSRLTFGKVQMELIGTPRNDILFTQGQESERKEKLGLPKDKKVILFAPTFRSDNLQGKGYGNIYRSGIEQLQKMDITLLLQTLSEKFGGDWVLVCRFHYHVESLMDWEEIKKRYNGQIINGNLHDDMSEYLACADVLLTDASSSMFDFAYTKKPCFLFFPDLEYYKNFERGFYMPMEQLPFSTSETFSELIQSLKEFDETKYIADAESMLNDMDCVDDINSTERVVSYILKRISLP